MEKRKKQELEEFSTEKDCLNYYDIKVIILSRGRSKSITTTNILPDWVECLVPESELEDYKRSIVNPILTVPDSIVGLGQLRNWVLEHFENRIVIMIDDDISCLYSLTKETSERIEDPEAVLQVLINTSVMADDLGVCCFGFNQSDIRKYNSAEPFKFNGWVGGCIGVIGRDYSFRDDKFKVDIDFCLKNLLYERIIFVDYRYLFSQKRDNNAGGNALFRSDDDYQKSLRLLLRKWSPYLKKKEKKGQISLITNISRRQCINYE